MRLNIINLIDNLSNLNQNILPQINDLGRFYNIPFCNSCKDVFKSGQNYIILEQELTGAIKLFNYLLSQGEPGIIVTRNHPDKLITSMGLNKYKEIPMYWLSTENFDYVIHPWEITLLIKTLENFIKEHDNGVILLNGLEYMSTYNESSKMLNIIFNIIDIVRNTNAKILITLDPLALDNQFFFNIKNNSEISIIPSNPLREVLD